MSPRIDRRTQLGRLEVKLRQSLRLHPDDWAEREPLLMEYHRLLREQDAAR